MVNCKRSLKRKPDPSLTDRTGRKGKGRFEALRVLQNSIVLIASYGTHFFIKMSNI